MQRKAMADYNYAYIHSDEGADKAGLDFMIPDCNGRTAMVAFFDRSQSSVRALAAGFQGKNGCRYRLTHEVGKGYGSLNLSAYCKDGYNAMIAPVYDDKEEFYHALVASREIGTTYFLATEENKEEVLFSHLMNNYALPLLPEWSKALWDALYQTRYLRSGDTPRVGLYAGEPMLEICGKQVPVANIRCYEMQATEEYLKEVVTRLMKTGKISFGTRQMPSLSNVDTLDHYFNEHGSKIVQNLERQLTPLTEFNGNVDDFTLKHRRLYPQQAVMVHGMKALLLGQGNRKQRRKTASNYCIVNEGMGCGKTLQGAALCEAIGVAKALNAKKGTTLKDVYEKGAEGVNYRNIVMCPGHLVMKWAEEIRSEVPFAKVEILDDLEQLIAIKEAGIERKGREFYIIGKDFAKLSYQEVPTPTKVRKMPIKQKHCANPFCHGSVVKGFVCEKCGGTEFRFSNTSSVDTGLCCPKCANLLIAYRKVTSTWDKVDALKPEDFATHTSENDSCYYCGERLWQPHVGNLVIDGQKPKEKTWIRATHYSNAAQKNTKTVWVHRKYMDEYFASVGQKPLNFPAGEGTRRVAPGYYMKKHMKGYFDVAIFDEVHNLKGGTTAQGNTMHAIIKASKKQLALTGTIAGGYATHLFYLLYRMDPARMKEKGYEFNSEMAFAKAYGCVDTEYEVEERGHGAYLTTCKGKQKSSPKCKPGISPLIFTEFLLDKTVFLDITDMSKYMPPLKESVELVDLDGADERDMYHKYNYAIDAMKKHANSGAGMTILSTMLQFSLSYLDKPYGVKPIKSAISGAVVVEPENFPQFSSLDRLLSKEQHLVNIVTAELSEGRNCFVYAEYTGSPETCVSYRLRDVLLKHCGLKENEVVILESSSPSTKEREEWIHKKAAAGAKVFITNPRCVETGLDFVFKYEGKSYNYPTIIFYQMGYNLFTIWQASRRHYRLSQKEECRTYYLAYAGTVQEAAIKLVAEKMSATSAIQGKFSSEGLSAMASGVDARIKLAKALSDMDSETGADLQGMFDVMNGTVEDEDAYADYEPMKLLHEIIDSAVIERTVEEMQEESNLFEFLALAQKEFIPVVNGKEKTNVDNDFTSGISVALLSLMSSSLGTTKTSFSESNQEENVTATVYVAPMVAEAKKKKAKKEKTISGQVSFFELFGM